jgi:eukaryotic-like serine/threonine-protein kinase
VTDVNALESLYFAALEKSPEARAAFLDDACRDNPNLRAKVEELLSAQPHLAGFLEPAAGGKTATFSPDGTTKPHPSPGIDESIGSVVAGKYKLLESIGEGGMGSVYMAQQTEPVKRKVAVKLIKAGMTAGGSSACRTTVPGLPRRTSAPATG